MQETEIQKKERALEGATKGRDERMFTILECHVDVDLEGFEDLDPTLAVTALLSRQATTENP